MILKVLKDYVASSVTGSYYVGFLPSVNTATAFIPTGGMMPEVQHGYNKPTFQVVTRDTDYSAGYIKAMAIYNKLQGLAGTVGSYFIVQVQALQSEPATFRDDQERHTFTQNYLVEYRYLTENRE